MNLQIGDHIIYSPVGDPTSWMSFVVTAAPTNNTSWVQVTVVKLDQAEWSTRRATTERDFSVLRFTPTPDTLGGVHDIDTDELLIPRIAPPLKLRTSHGEQQGIDVQRRHVDHHCGSRAPVGDVIDVTA